MNLIDSDDINNLYLDDEEDFLIEDQDLRIIKGIISDPHIAKDFAISNNANLLFGDAKNFASLALDFYNKFDTLPSRRTMMESFGESNSISKVWDLLDQVDFNKSDFKFDLEKLKQKYSFHKVSSMQKTIEESDNIDETLKYIRKELDEVEQVRRNDRKIAFVQKTMRDYLPEFRNEYTEKSKNPELGRGILTRYSYLDYITNGLVPSDLLIVGAETGAGKALPLDTKIPTPDGFKMMKDIKPGDFVFGKDGKICKVIAESKVFNDPGWKFIFNDHTEIISHDNHEWFTFDTKDLRALSKRKPEFRAKQRIKRGKKSKPWLIGKNVRPNPTGSVKTSKEIVATLKYGKNNRNNHAIPIANAIDLPAKILPIDPYLFGLWLGDGSKSDAVFTTADFELVFEFVKNGYPCSRVYNKLNKDGTISKAKAFGFTGLVTELRKLKVFNNKHVPEDYLWSSKDQRLALLQGLMDSDGTVSKSGNCIFTNTNKKIVDAFNHLIVSLGEKCSVVEGVAKCNGNITGPKWDVYFTPDFDAFRLKRKLKKQNKNYRLNKLRYIVDAVRMDAIPMKCIQVDSEDHLFLAGTNFIPTHNSMLLSNMAIQIWMQDNNIEMKKTDYKKGYNIQYFSLEMPFDQCFRRAFSRIGALPTYGLRDACITKPDMLKRMSDSANFINKYPFNFEIVDIPRGVTIKNIEERYLESCSLGNAPDVVIVDYLGLMEDPDSNGDDWLRLGHIAGQLHEFARAYNVIVLSAVQLNRAKNRDPEESIGLHRIGRSSLIMHHASIGIQIETRKNEEALQDLRYHIIKNRNGEKGSHLLKKDFRTATLCDLEVYKPKHSDSSLFIAKSPLDQEDISEVLANYGWLA